jgi:hypothetical protein
MRLPCVLLILLLAGCGSGSRNRSQNRHVGFAVSPPAIAALVPSVVPANSVPFTMTINGNNFGTDAVVFWNGTVQQTTFVTSSQLMVAVTDTDLMSVGLAHVFVRTAGMNSNTVDFDVTPQ